MSVRGPREGASFKPSVSRPESKPSATPASTAKAARNVAAAATQPAGAQDVAVFDHEATVNLTTDPGLTPAMLGGRRVTDAVMKCIGSYDKSFLLATDALKTHVQSVATQFVAEADTESKKGSLYQQLKAKYPGATICLVGTASTQKDDQVYYLVKTRDGDVKKFENQGGKPVETPKANGEIFMAAELGSGKHMAVRVPEVRFLINPTLAPAYGVGRTIDVVLDTPIALRNSGDATESQGDGLTKEILPGTQKGEDGNPLGIILQDKTNDKGVILKYNGDKTYDVQVAQRDGSQKVVRMTEDEIREENDPAQYNLHGSTFDDVSINVDTDPKLKAFMDEAKAISDKDIPTSGSPEDVANGQRQALTDLTILCNKWMSYPDETPNTTDANSKKCMDLMNSHSNWNPMPLGDLLDCGRGVCRHQAIIMQLACQQAGITSRTVFAAANDGSGNFRGYHAFLETTLDDGKQYLTDPTWFDAGPVNVKGYTGASPVVNGQLETGTALWDTLYDNVERQELPGSNAIDNVEDHSQVGFQENNDPVIDAQGHVVVKPANPNPPTPVTPTPPASVPSTDDTLKKMEVAIWGQDFSAWASQYQNVTADQASQSADYYLGQNNPTGAAFCDSLALHLNPTDDQKKQLWSKLAGALAQIPNRPDLASVVADAQAIANSLNPPAPAPQ